MSFTFITEKGPQEISPETSVKTANPSSAKIKFYPDTPPIPEPPESLPETIKRNVLRSGSRIGETVLGLPGDVVNLTDKAAKFLAEKISGKPIEEKSAITKILPSSSELQRKAESLSNGYLKPKTDAERLSDEIISDFTSLALPVKGLKSLGSGRLPLLTPLYASLGANLSKEGAKNFGLSEGAQDATKLGSLFVLTAFNPKGASRYVDSLYKEAQSLLPANAKAPASGLKSSLDKLEVQLKKGGTAPYKSPTLTKIQEIRTKIKNGKIPVDELAQFKIDINKARESLYLSPDLDKGGRAIAKRNLDSVANIVDEGLNEYGKLNPAWEKAYRPANEAYGAIAQSRRASNFINRTFRQNPSLSSLALAAELFYHPSAAKTGLHGAVYGGIKSYELFQRIKKSPVLRKYYSQVAKSAVKEDSASVIKNLGKLDEELKKEEN